MYHVFTHIMSLFTPFSEDEPERSHSGPITTSTHQRAVFSMGDRVIVCEGEMKNITGIVTSIGKNTATITPDRQFNINVSDVVYVYCCCVL